MEQKLYFCSEYYIGEFMAKGKHYNGNSKKKRLKIKSKVKFFRVFLIIFAIFKFNFQLFNPFENSWINVVKS